MDPWGCEGFESSRLVACISGVIDLFAFAVLSGEQKVAGLLAHRSWAHSIWTRTVEVLRVT
jgi:hypothetical protein